MNRIASNEAVFARTVQEFVENGTEVNFENLSVALVRNGYNPSDINSEALNRLNYDIQRQLAVNSRPQDPGHLEDDGLKVTDVESESDSDSDMSRLLTVPPQPDIRNPIVTTVNNWINRATDYLADTRLGNYISERFGLDIRTEPIPFTSQDIETRYPFEYPVTIDGGYGTGNLTSQKSTIVNSKIDNWLNDATQTVNSGLRRDMPPSDYFELAQEI